MERRIDDPTLTETVAANDAPKPRSVAGISRISSSSSTEDEGRFIAGTLLGGRYRIIGMLGRGGMGEVYRATDLTLGQSVALKFLPAEAAGNDRLLERFAGEVRVARQVSHPNVCRVYDLGEVDGAPFISMEYVDGEDLSSLLPRIGRLPADKAIETARKLCAGLAAAHDRGIIHRDLKPQNIMMNKRGDVVIMDFGLAAIADQLSGAEARNGTPAYMAPEQLKGAEVTARSDIFALGLVLYEVFTGKKPYDAKTVPQLLSMQESGQLISMTSLAADIDPAVEKVIRRCLDPDPLKRPSSALSVAAQLPGGDPLAAALAAGETPPPELVAAAGTTDGMPLRYSIPCFAAVVLMAVVVMPAFQQRGLTLMHGSLDYPPEVLAQKGRDISVALGYPKKPADTYISIDHRWNLIVMLRGLPQPRKWDEWLAAEAPIMADYRESPEPMVAEPFGYVEYQNPAPIVRGMVDAVLDGHGLLRHFSAVPYDENPAQNPVDPTAVFRLAGLDQATFTENTPRILPQHASDVIRAWKGPHPALPNTELWVEIAMWKGRFTQVHVEFPYDRPASQRQAAVVPPWTKFRDFLMMAAKGAAGFFAILLAFRNWKKERVDKKGALRIATFSFVLSMITWAGRVHPVASNDLFSLFFAAAADSLLWSSLLWLVYLALEPPVRARWPHAIVTWNRILSGRWADAQVGSHILIGATLGTASLALFMVKEALENNDLNAGLPLWSLMGLRTWVASSAGVFNSALYAGLLAFFAIFGLRVILKRDWLAAVIASLLFTFSEGSIVNAANIWETAFVYFFIYSLLMFVLLRVGLVTTLAMIVFVNLMNRIAMGSDLRTWWAPYGLASITLIVGITAYAFWRSIGNQERSQ